MDAVVEQPWGAYPFSCYRQYEHDAEHIQLYQAAARAGGEEYEDYLQTHVYGCETFDGFLDRAAGGDRLQELREGMLALL